MLLQLHYATVTRRTRRASCNAVSISRAWVRGNVISALYGKTRNVWQSLAYSPLGVVVSTPSDYLIFRRHSSISEFWGMHIKGEVK